MSKKRAALFRATRDALSALRQYSDSGRLERALNRLAELVEVRECADIMVDYGDGVDKSALDVMLSWQTAALQVACCKALASFTQHSAALRDRLETAKAWKMVIDAILRHPADTFVQSAAMRCLGAMAKHCSAAVRAELRKDDVLRLIVQSMTTHQIDVHVQQHGCGMLAALLDNTGEESRAALNWFARSNEHWRIVKTLVTHAGDTSVQVATCNALARLSVHAEIRSQLVEGAVYNHVSCAVHMLHTYRLTSAFVRAEKSCTI